MLRRFKSTSFSCPLLVTSMLFLFACDRQDGNSQNNVDGSQADTSQVENSQNVAALTSPAPQSIAEADAAISSDSWWSPNEDRAFHEFENYANERGLLSVFKSDGEISASGHPFFTALGSNGRACVTCHQPADGMSLSVKTIQERWQLTDGKDPLFAAIDGSDCPNLPQQQKSSHSLLIDHGLFRIFRPWPPEPINGVPVEPQFTIEVLRDPTTCNNSSEYGLLSEAPMISVYRRPRATANLKFITAMGFPFEPKNGLPLPLDPETNLPVSGNITADSRVWTLKQQARDALITHLEIESEPSDELLEQIVNFETKIYAAQSFDFKAGDLSSDGAKGGPRYLAEAEAGVLNSGTRLPMWDEFESWLKYLDGDTENRKNIEVNGNAELNPEQLAQRQSIARGVKVFRDRTFLVSDNAGITDMGFGNPVRNDCNFCHNMTRTGLDVAPGQVDLGTTNSPYADPAPHLPLFKLTCKEGFAPHAHIGKVVFTTDPGLALTTGRCKDIGKITIQSMRGMSSRAPYFANGSANSIQDLVDFYERRYDMKFSEQEKQDIANLMGAL